jgi:sugar phosphate isomerase/epimerase
MRIKVSALVLSLVFFGSLFAPIAFAQAGQQGVITLKKYPDIKLGILANNFYKPLPMNKDNLKKIFDWAAANGFAWVEIRDANGALTLTDCKELAAYAVSKKIEIVYALGIGFLDPNFDVAFIRGISNAAQFTGPKVIRTSAPGPEFTADPAKSTWTKAEFDVLLPIANKAADLAKKLGLQLVLEHAFEAMEGDGVNTFGMTEIQTKGNANIGSQYDTANFFAVSRAPVTPDKAKAYFEKFASKTYYAHLKTSNAADHKVTPVLGDNELDFGVFFDICTKAKINYLAIEIPQQEKFEDAAFNLQQSVYYLKSKY